MTQGILSVGALLAVVVALAGRGGAGSANGTTGGAAGAHHAHGAGNFRASVEGEAVRPAGAAASTNRDPVVRLIRR